jgi:hypothetical protein
MLMCAQSDLDAAHVEACAALARFDEIHADKTADPDTRMASTSLRAETLAYCEQIRAAMNLLPEAAKPEQKMELPPLRTAASMLRDVSDRKTNRRFKAQLESHVVATSARYGKPIVAAISCLLLCAIPLTGKADSCRLTPDSSRSIERVIDALIQIESNGQPSVIGDDGKAVGLLQIHPVAVREANRIAGENRWKLSDRTCPAKSRAMARTILTWHYLRGVKDPIELACRWNRPFGREAAHYRAKVKDALAKI